MQICFTTVSSSAHFPLLFSSSFPILSLDIAAIMSNWSYGHLLRRPFGRKSTATTTSTTTTTITSATTTSPTGEAPPIAPFEHDNTSCDELRDALNVVEDSQWDEIFVAKDPNVEEWEIVDARDCIPAEVVRDTQRVASRLERKRREIVRFVGRVCGSIGRVVQGVVVWVGDVGIRGVLGGIKSGIAAKAPGIWIAGVVVDGVGGVGSKVDGAAMVVGGIVGAVVDGVVGVFGGAAISRRYRHGDG
jgi:hypothetical protein